MKPEPPSEELRALLSQMTGGSADPGVPDAARTRLTSRLAPLFDAPPPPSPPPSPAAAISPLAKWAAISALAVAAGVAATFALRSPPGPATMAPPIAAPALPPPHEVSVNPSPPEATPAPPPLPVGAISPSPAPTTTPTPTTTTTPTPTSTSTSTPTPTPTPTDSLSRERQLIDSARAALTSGDPSRAASLAAEHERAFPHGQLAEMREAVLIQALATQGKTSDARARARQFHQAFPSSIYAVVVDDAVRGLP